MGVGVDGVDEVVHVLIRHQALERAVELVGADVDHADAVVRIEHGDGVVRAYVGPVGDGLDVAGAQRVQQQRRQGEVVDAVHLGCDFDLLLVVGVHFDEDFQTALDAFLTQTGDQLEGLRGHEAAGAGFLGAIADGVETDVADVGSRHLVEDGHEVFPALVGIGVDVHLLRGEADPHEAGLAGELVVGERQARTRTVDAGQVLFGGAVREHGAHGEEHRIVFGLLALGQHVLELLGFPAHVVDDGVDHDVVGLGKLGDVVPAAETLVDLGVVDRVEACVGAVERGEERQDVNAVVHAVEAGAQNVGHRLDGAVAKAVGVSDELHLVFHGASFGSKKSLRDSLRESLRPFPRLCRTGSILPQNGARHQNRNRCSGVSNRLSAESRRMSPAPDSKATDMRGQPRAQGPQPWAQDFSCGRSP